MKPEIRERIMLYLEGQMTEAERVSFEQEQAADPELAQLVALHRSINSTMNQIYAHEEDESQIRLTLVGLNKRYFPGSNKAAPQLLPGGGQVLEPLAPDGQVSPTNKANVRPLWLRLAVAAAVLIAVAAGSFWLLRQDVVPNEIAEQNKETEINDSAKKKTPPQDSAGAPVPPADRSVSNVPETTDVNNSPKILTKQERRALFSRHFSPDPPPRQYGGPLEQAMHLYRSGDYKGAIATFEQMERAPLTRGGLDFDAPTLFYLHYYKALSHLATGNTAAAISSLAKTAPATRIQQTKRDWYLALARLKRGQTQEATALLRRLSANNAAGPYRQKAAALLHAIGQP